MDSLDDHDGIVHHNGYGEEQCREHKQVDGESEYPEEEECTYQCHRHRNHRDECGAEVLQEDVNHEEHEQQCYHQREDNLLDGCEEELRDVVVYLVFNTRREALGLPFQLGLYILRNLCGVGAGNLLHHTHY